MSEVMTTIRRIVPQEAKMVKRKILYMDDDKSVLQLIGSFFEELGYDVIVAEDGEKGLDMFSRYDPHIVLIDLRMPKVSGFEVLEQLHKQHPTVPLLVLSGEGERSDVIKALRLGAWNYHTKPVKNLTLLQHSVEDALNKADLIRENEAYRKGLENKLTTIVNNFTGYIFTVNRECRLTYMNEPLLEYVGYNALGMPCHQAIWGEKEKCSQCPIHESGEPLVDKYEFQSPKDGRWFYNIYSTVFDKDGNVQEIQVILYDITERKLAQQALEEREDYLRKENVRLRASLNDRYKFDNIIGRSIAMQKVYETIIHAASSDAAVIIYGESGTGKELVAKAIHDHSDRKDEELVYVNCGAIPENLIESEFFGYKKGAFSGAIKDKHGFLDIADRGTLFLDEVGEISLNMQIKLLRAIEGNGYTPIGGVAMKYPNVRIIAATNRDLKEQVREGAMRQDFLYRIHIIPVQLPPLRERREDIPLLVEHFLTANDAADLLPLTAELNNALQQYDWPGNVRELQNTLRRFVTLGALDFMGSDLSTSTATTALSRLPATLNNCSLAEQLDQVEHSILLQACEQNSFHLGNTAKALQVDRKTLYRKMKHHGLEKPASRK